MNLEQVRDSVDAGSLQLYRSDLEGFLRCVREVLAVDIRSPHQQEGEDRVASLRLDSMVITYRITAAGDVVVEAVREWHKNDDGLTGSDADADRASNEPDGLEDLVAL